MRPGVLRVFIYFYLRLGYTGTDESWCRGNGKVNIDC
jgi:hypothetical protein